MIHIECPFCKASLEMGDEFAGKLVRCGECRNVVIAPGASAAPAEAPAPAAPAPAPKTASKPKTDPAPQAVKRPAALPARKKPLVAMPPVTPKKPGSGAMPFAIACLLLLAIAGGALYYLKFMRANTRAGDPTLTEYAPTTPDAGEPSAIPSNTLRIAATPTPEGGESDPDEDSGTPQPAEGENQVGLMETDLPFVSPGEVGPSTGMTLAQPRVDELIKALERDKYVLTHRVKEVYFKVVKAQVLDDLKAAGKTVPDKFIRWIDSDDLVQATVYGAKPTPANVLLMLYSFQFDLGEANLKKYIQPALAAAVLREKEGPNANLAQRKPLEIEIPPCPLVPVNTRDKKRQLDVNDHIINFLNEDYKLYKAHNSDRTPTHKKDGAVAAFH